MDKNSEKKCQVPHKYYIVNCGSFTGCRFICNDQYASEIYYSGDHYSIVSGCNLFLVDSISIYLMAEKNRKEETV